MRAINSWVAVSLVLGLSLLTMAASCNKPAKPDAQQTKAPASSTLSPVSRTVTTYFHVEGMHCADCNVAIEQAVMAISGVSEVKADFASLSVMVKYDTSKVSVGTVIGVINPLGYKAGISSDQTGPGDNTAPAHGMDPATETPPADPAATGEKTTDAALGAEGGACASCAEAKAVEQLPAAVPAGMARTSFSVPGMTCAGKAGKVTQALLVLEGVAGCAADAAKLSVTVDYDPKALMPKAIILAIKGVGFEATELTPAGQSS